MPKPRKNNASEISSEDSGKFISRVIDASGVTHVELSKRADIHRLVIGRHANGGVTPDRPTRVKYAKAFNMNPDAFEREYRAGLDAIKKDDPEALERSVQAVVAAIGKGAGGNDEASVLDPTRIPESEKVGWLRAYGHVPAGALVDFEMNVNGEKLLPPALYAAPEESPIIVFARGNSMEPLIHDGDVVVLAKRFRRPPRSGDIVAVELAQENGRTIKWLEIKPNGDWLLKPRNPDHPTRTVTPQELKSSAVVVGWYHPVHRPGEKDD